MTNEYLRQRATAARVVASMSSSTTVRDQHRRAIARTKPPCGICGDPIDYNLKSPDPMSFEVDHVIPRAAGGPDTLANKQASHRKCNRTKWHRIVMTTARQFVTSRTW